MSDLQKYIQARKLKDVEFSIDFDEGYQEFKIGVLLKALRLSRGLSQETLAQMSGSKKSAISRMENHAQDMKLSTLAHLATALGKTIRIELIDKSGK